MFSSSETLDWPPIAGPLDADSSLSPTVFALSPFSPLPRSVTRSSTSASSPLKYDDTLFSSLLPSTPPSMLPPSDQLSPSPTSHSCQPPADLLASLAFDPALLLAQLDAPPSDTVPQPPRSEVTRKRERLTGLTQQQRAIRKKEQHRVIDAHRRQREQVVVSKMQQLMGVNKPLLHKRHRSDTNSTSTASNTDSESSSEEREDEYEEPTRRKVDKSDRVSVLERAAEHMERMQVALQQMAAACTRQQQQFRAFIDRQQQLCATSSAAACTCSTSPGRSCSCCPPHPLSALHPLLTQRLATQINSGALDSCSYISASISMFVVSLKTGRILDVNSRYLSAGGWERHHLVDRLMLAPQAVGSGPADTAAKINFVNDRFLIDGPDGRLVPAPLYEQYERSKQSLRQLITGEREMVRAVWRTSLKDGKLCELEALTWAGGHMDVRDRVTGATVRRPAYLVYVSALDTRVCTQDDKDVR